MFVHKKWGPPQTPRCFLWRPAIKNWYIEAVGAGLRATRAFARDPGDSCFDLRQARIARQDAARSQPQEIAIPDADQVLAVGREFVPVEIASIAIPMNLRHALLRDQVRGLRPFTMALKFWYNRPKPGDSSSFGRGRPNIPGSLSPPSKVSPSGTGVSIGGTTGGCGFRHTRAFLFFPPLSPASDPSACVLFIASSVLNRNVKT